MIRVSVEYSCGGCALKEATQPLLRRPHDPETDFGTLKALVPEGWTMDDSYPNEVYCPDCWAAIEGGQHQ